MGRALKGFASRFQTLHFFSENEKGCSSGECMYTNKRKQLIKLGFALLF